MPSILAGAQAGLFVVGAFPGHCDCLALANILAKSLGVNTAACATVGTPFSHTPSNPNGLHRLRVRACGGWVLCQLRCCAVLPPWWALLMLTAANGRNAVT